MPSFLDPVLSPILSLNPTMALFLLSFFISLMVTLIYKWTTDQNLMKQLKDEISSLQAQLKALQHDPQKSLDVQKRAMEVNMKYMMHSFRSTFFTLIPMIFIFGFLSAHFASDPILPYQEFKVTANFDGDGANISLVAPEGVTLLDAPTKEITANQAVWGLKGVEGSHILQFNFKNETVYKKVLITNIRDYEEPLQAYTQGSLKSIEVSNPKTIILNLFGWRLGWLGSYILFSIIFSMILRKYLKVY